jgi:ubiquinone/menaquinone biosynthesis C-methylase UbiE
MVWYDWFSNIYDSSLEKLYAEHRVLAANALQLDKGSVVLDLPCGTGQSFDEIRNRVGEEGHLVGIDLSKGMLRRAQERAQKNAWQNVTCLQKDAALVTQKDVHEAAGKAISVDRLHIFLGMSVFPDMESTFTNLWNLLPAGGQCVIVDVHTEKLNFQGWMVNKIAGADIRRRFWEPLEKVADRFERTDLPFHKQHGGQIMMAYGIKK